MGKAPKQTSVKMLQASYMGSVYGQVQFGCGRKDAQMFQYVRFKNILKSAHLGSNGFIHWNSHQPEYGLQ